MKEKTDYEAGWPELVPQFCDEQIAKLQKKLKSGDLKKPRKDGIKARISVFKRIRADYAKKESEA